MKTMPRKLNVYPHYKSIKNRPKLLAVKFTVLLLLITTMPVILMAQAPLISYSSPHTYTTGKSVTLAPTSTGVAAPGYSNPITLASGLTQPIGLARNAAGNIYVLDFDQTRDSSIIKKIPVGGGGPIIIGTTADEATAIAVDAPGNIYVANNNLFNTLQKIPAGGGTPVNITDYLFISSLFVDAAGNLIVATPVSGGWQVSMIPVSGGVLNPIPQLVNRPEAITFDAAGNLFYAAAPSRRGNGSIQELLRGDDQPTQLGDASLTAGPLTTDASGNLYVANSNTIKEIPAGTTTPLNRITGLGNITGIVTDALGNLYITANNQVEKITPSGGYNINPALPAGLKFSKTTGIISGIPTVASPATNYTITAYNAFGSTSATVSIGTKLPGLPTISYSGPQTYITGTAISPLTPMSTGVAAPGYNKTPTIIGSGFEHPIAVAVDGAGNIYALDLNVSTDSSTIKKIPASGGTPVIIGKTSDAATFIAADAEGNVYVASYDFFGSLQKIPAGGGAPVTVGKFLESIDGLCTDAAGNVYLATASDSEVLMIPAGGGTPVTYATSIAQSLGIALDATGNLYFAAFELHRQPGSVQEKHLDNSFPVRIGSGFVDPYAVAVDRAGDVFIADAGNAAIKEIPAGTNDVITLVTGVSGLRDIAIDDAGVLYVTTNNQIEKFTPSGGYYISSSLPKGLAFDNATGAISGRPIAGSAAADYTVTAYNNKGGYKTKINITVNAVLPTVPAQKVIFSNITTNSAAASWTNGNGTARAVFIAQKTNGSALPTENSTYTANTVFGAGAEIGTTGWYCIYNGTGSSVNVTGLLAGTDYRVTVVEYYGGQGSEAYMGTKLSPASVTTVKIYPTVPALQVKFANTTATTTTASWTNGDGARRAVFIHTGIYGNALPVDNVNYTVNAKYKSGEQIGTTGWYCIYNGVGSTVDITGLSIYSAYRVTVVEYNGGTGNEKYMDTKLSPSNVYTNGVTAMNSLYLPGSGQSTTSTFSLTEEVEANNILSPNGDGFNDIWVVKNIAFYPNNTVTIYDKAGKVVFTKKGYNNDWDGSYRGSALNAGTYYYNIDLGTGDNIKGYITVVLSK